MSESTVNYLNGLGVSPAEEAKANALIAEFEGALKDRAFRAAMDSLCARVMHPLVEFADDYRDLLARYFGRGRDTELLLAAVLGWILGAQVAEEPEQEAGIGRQPQLLVAAYVAPWSAAHSARMLAALANQQRRLSRGWRPRLSHGETASCPGRRASLESANIRGGWVWDQW
jgi:hypothetical protein